MRIESRLWSSPGAGLPKKSDGVLREGVAVKYACIARHRREFHVRLMCRVLEVSASGFYASQKRAISERRRADEALLLDIRAAHRKSRKRYGSPRIHRELKAQGIAVGEKRVARVMRERGIRAKQARRFRVTTDSDHSHPLAPNILNRRFGHRDISGNAGDARDVRGGFITGVNQVWAADITYLPTREGWLYLAAVLDLFSRLTVGSSMKHTLDTSIVTDALGMALVRRRPMPGMLHHSDRGSQYASVRHRSLLARHGIECSMSRKGDCWDNAVVESFFASLKKELVHGSDWKTREEARAAVFEYIEVWYNRERRHSSLGYVSPAEYEERVLRKAA